MNRLKEFREEAMMTVRKLSERSGVSEDTITKIENGHRRGRGITLRKLVKALDAKPHELFPEDFARTTETEPRAPEILPQGGHVGFKTTGRRPPETGVREARTLEGALRRAFKVVSEVEVQSGLGAQDHLKSITERQRSVLLALVSAEELDPSAVAEHLGISVSTAYRDLAMLGEYGLVSCDTSGQRRLTSLGEGVAGVLARGGFYYDDALRYVASLVEAYQPVAGNERRGVDEIQSILAFELQALIVRTIGRLVAAAEPLPLAEEARNKYVTTPKGTGHGTEPEAFADTVRLILYGYMNNPPPLEVIQADIEGLPEGDVLEALDAVLTAHRTGHSTADPYENFRWNLKHNVRQSPSTQRSVTSDPQQASIRDSES